MTGVLSALRVTLVHILMLVQGYPSSYRGINSIYFRDQAEALVAAGHKVAVLAVVGISIREIWRERRLRFGFRRFEKDGVDTWKFEIPTFPKFRRFNSWLKLALGKHLITNYINTVGRPEVVFAQCQVVGAVALAAKKRWHLPYFMLEHSSELWSYPTWSPARKRRTSAYYSGAAIRAAVSERFAEFLQSALSLPFEYIPNLTDFSHWPTRPLKARRPDANFVFCSVAHLVAEKGYRLLFEAFALVAKTYPNVSLVIAGAGPELENLRRQAETLGILERIEFLGAVPREAVPGIFRRSDCLVHSSQKETFGVVLIEAMASGLPVVATRCGGPESIILNPSVGRLVAAEKNEFAMAMLQMIHEPLDSSTIRAFARDRFSKEVVGGALGDALARASTSTR